MIEESMPRSRQLRQGGMTTIFFVVVFSHLRFNRGPCGPSGVGSNCFSRGILTRIDKETLAPRL